MARRTEFPAQERRWVARIVARLTPEQRARYAEACRAGPRDRNGRLYDRARAEIAERILYEDRLKEAPPARPSTATPEES